ncbi:MAG TPA: hypothetical protein PK564_02235 [bacterium]|nr:hypothetical protein [bacterium]
MGISKGIGIGVVGAAALCGTVLGYNLTQQGRDNTMKSIGFMANRLGNKPKQGTNPVETTNKKDGNRKEQIVEEKNSPEDTIKETIDMLHNKIFELQKNQKISEEQYLSLRKQITDSMIDGEESIETFASKMVESIKNETDKNLETAKTQNGKTNYSRKILESLKKELETL